MARTVIRPAGTEEGSPEWLRTKADLARTWAEGADHDARQVVKYLAELRSHDWKALTGGDDDWPRFCREVLGKEPEFIDCLEVGVAALDGSPTVGEAVQHGRSLRDKAGAPEGNQNASKNNCNKNEKSNHCFARGNSSTYRKLKLRRDAPEIANRLEAGEFKSVAAAERAARGEEPHPPRKVPTPLGLGKRAWAKMSKAERRKFRAWLDTPEAND